MPALNNTQIRQLVDLLYYKDGIGKYDKSDKDSDLQIDTAVHDEKNRISGLKLMEKMSYEDALQEVVRYIDPSSSPFHQMKFLREL